MTKNEAMRRTRMFEVLQNLGFTQIEAEKLRRISMTLQRWHGLECGTGEGQVSVSVERENADGTGKPYKRIQYPTANGYVDRRYPIADRETGARKRLLRIVNDRAQRVGKCDVLTYVQGDPRGAALYILRPGDIPKGMTADACYSRGICVY